MPLFNTKSFLKTRLIPSALWFVAVFSALLCTGCPPTGLCITVPDKRADNFVIQVSDESKGCKGQVVVTRMIVRRVSDDKVFWVIGSVEDVKLDIVHYGVLPAGFDQGMAPLPLQPGDEMNISAQGRGTAGGIAAMVAP